MNRSLSARARAFLETRGVRRPDRTCDRGTLVARLEAAGLPVHDAVLDFEERLGGVSFATHGTLGCLEMMRSHDRARWRSGDRVLVGDYGQPPRLLYMGAGGGIRPLLEHLALHEQAIALAARGVEAYLPGRSGAELALALGCPPVPEASFAPLRWWADDEVHILDGEGRLRLFAATVAAGVRALRTTVRMWPDASAGVLSSRAVREQLDADDAPTVPPFEGPTLSYAGWPGEQGEVRLHDQAIEQIAWLGGRLEWAHFATDTATVRAYGRVMIVPSLLALETAPRPAVIDDRGTTSFAELVARVRAAAGALGPLGGRRVALLLGQDADWVVAFLGTLFAGGVAVPLSPAYPAHELAWFGEDSGADTVILGAEHAARGRDLAASRRVLTAADLVGTPAPPPTLGPDSPAVILYTSGTTGRPKGAVLTHGNLATQASLVGRAWGVTAEDRLLHALPLHHLHGLCVALLNVLCAGAAVHMLPRFDAERVVVELDAGAATMWMAVPTMYHRLREHAGDDPRLRRGAARLRLATSGSAALPVSLASWWQGLTGAIPLERFGMTEIGVGLSNPLDPARRRLGSVGVPLPTVEIRIVGEDGADADHGELWVRGPSVFPGYHTRPEATLAAFSDGWFKSGDVAERDADGYIRLLGRTSIDILKSGGYKISALEIEETFREHPEVAEVAVVGVADERWGERVVAAVVCRGDAAAEGLRAWAKERLATYKVPREVVLLAELPRNPMGKVMKPELVKKLRDPASG